MKPGEGFLRNKIKSVADEHLICREIYNPNKFSLIFIRNIDKDMYILRSRIPLGQIRVACKPDDWLFLPHGYYFAKGEGIPDGEPISWITNFGDSIGKGNKLPSAPIAETRSKQH